MRVLQVFEYKLAPGHLRGYQSILSLGNHRYPAARLGVVDVYLHELTLRCTAVCLYEEIIAVVVYELIFRIESIDQAYNRCGDRRPFRIVEIYVVEPVARIRPLKNSDDRELS